MFTHCTHNEIKHDFDQQKAAHNIKEEDVENAEYSDRQDMQENWR